MPVAVSAVRGVEFLRFVVWVTISFRFLIMLTLLLNGFYGSVSHYVSNGRLPLGSVIRRRNKERGIPTVVLLPLRSCLLTLEFPVDMKVCSNFYIFSFQRGSDELLSQSGAVSNGSVMSPQPNHSDNNNEAKKVSGWVHTEMRVCMRLEMNFCVKCLIVELRDAACLHYHCSVFSSFHNVRVCKMKSIAY